MVHFKGETMKKVLILILVTASSIYFSGCDLDNSSDFESVDSRDILTANDWYYIDPNADEYTVANITDNMITQDFYTDSSFSEVAYTKQYKIEYEDDTLYLTDEYGEHICKYNSCENNEWMMITCDANQPFVKGWSTRALAAAKAAD